MMKRLCLLVLLLVVLLCKQQIILAAGVPANSQIINTATVSYEVEGSPQVSTATSILVVQEIADVSVVWQDAATIKTLSPSTANVATFLVTNLGNGLEQFALAVSTILPGDDFDPIAATAQIWIDDGDAVFDTASDTFYNGSNGPVLNGGLPGSEAIIIFAVVDTPAGLTAGELGNISLNATAAAVASAGQVGNVGGEIVNAGDGGVDITIGASGGTSTGIAALEVVDSGITITKTVQVIDRLGGDSPVTGATLRYSLLVEIIAGRAVSNLVIRDPIPANTIYNAGSILLDSAVQTDAVDAPVDFSDYNISNANSITVDLSQGGTVVIAPPATFIISFEVSIN